MSRRLPIAAPTHLGVIALTALILALPLLLGALALGTGGLPHEGLHAANTHDVSAAALDRMERYLHGDLNVALAAPSPVGVVTTPDARGCGSPPAGHEPAAAFPAAATAELRL